MHLFLYKHNTSSLCYIQVSAYCHELLYEQYVSYHLLQDISREKEFAKLGQRSSIILITRTAVSLLHTLVCIVCIWLQPDAEQLALLWEEEGKSSPLAQVFCVKATAAHLRGLTQSWRSLGIQTGIAQLIKAGGHGQGCL